MKIEEKKKSSLKNAYVMFVVDYSDLSLNEDFNVSMITEVSDVAK